MNIVQCTTGCQLMRSCHAWHAILSLMSATVLNHHHCHHFRLMILVFLMPRENSPYNMCLTYLRLFIAKLYYYVPLRGGNKYKEKSLESVNKIRLTALIKTLRHHTRHFQKSSKSTTDSSDFFGQYSQDGVLKHVNDSQESSTA